jgi:hypothetical protein
MTTRVLSWFAVASISLIAGAQSPAPVPCAIGEMFPAMTDVPVRQLAQWIGAELMAGADRESFTLVTTGGRWNFTLVRSRLPGGARQRDLQRGTAVDEFSWVEVRSDQNDEELFRGYYADRLTPETVFVNAKAALERSGYSAVYDRPAGIVRVNNEWRSAQFDAHRPASALRRAPTHADSPDGQVPLRWRAYAANGSTMAIDDVIYDQATGWAIGGVSPAKGFAWHPGGCRYAVMTHNDGPSGTVEIYDLGGAIIGSLSISKWHHSMSFSADGRFLVFPGERLPVP